MKKDNLLFYTLKPYVYRPGREFVDNGQKFYIDKIKYAHDTVEKWPCFAVYGRRIDG